MKFSYNWLREMVEGLDTPPAELERLMQRGLEREAFRRFACEERRAELIAVPARRLRLIQRRVGVLRNK